MCVLTLLPTKLRASVAAAAGNMWRVASVSELVATRPCARQGGACAAASHELLNSNALNKV